MATVEGTARLAARFREQFVASFYTRLTSGVLISSIGLGTYLGESTDADDAAYIGAIRQAIKSGVNLLDTAINYRGERSERALCVALRQAITAGDATRDELFVCTKGGYIPLGKAQPTTREEYQAYVQREFVDTEIVQASDIVAGGHCLAPRFLRYCLAKSRQNLGLRAIDLYYIHNPEQQLGVVEVDVLYARLEAAFAMLEEAVERGEIRSYGIATWDGLRVPPDHQAHLNLERVVDTAKRAGGDAHHFRAVQLPVNLAMSEAVRVPTQIVVGRMLTVLQAADQLGVSVIGSATLMQSRLASGLPAAIRDHFPSLTTDAQRAVAFARSIEGLSASLIGMKSVAHVDENLGALRV